MPKARANLQAEGMAGGKPLGFERMKARPGRQWQRELSSVRIEGGMPTTAPCSTPRCITRCCSR
jgi:hypothetical protein